MTPTASTFDLAIIWFIAGWAVVALGTVLLAWALFRDRARGRRRCPKCWYDMAGAPSLKCPECGRAAKNDRTLFRTRRKWGWAVVAVVLLAAGYTSTRVPAALEHGLLDAVPVVVLRPALWLERERAERLYQSHVATNSQGVLRSALIRMPGGPFTAPGTAAPTKQTQWERLLIASAVSRRIEVEGAYIERAHDLALLESLGRDARPAHTAIRRALHREPSRELITTVINFAIAGHRGMRADLSHLLNAKLDEAERRRVLVALIEAEIGDGRLSAPVRAAIRDEPCGVDEIQKWVRLANGSAKPSEAMIDLVTILLRRPDMSARQAAMPPVLSWIAAGHWSESLAESLWQESANHDTLCLVGFMIAGCAVDLDKWGPRLLQLAEHESVEVRTGALNALYHRATRQGWAGGELDRWLVAIDRTKPLPNSERRRKREWVLEHLAGSLAVEPVVVTTLANAAGATRDEVISLLTPIAFDAAQPRSRRAAIVGIADLGLDADSAHALAQRIWGSESDAYVRATVIDSLVRPHLTDERMRALLDAALSEASSVVLIITVQVASELENPSAGVVRRLEELAQSESESVAFMSRRSLAAIRERLAAKQSGSEPP